MNNITAITGNADIGDCKIQFTLTNQNNNTIKIIKSNNNIKKINEIILNFLNFYNIKNSIIEIEDFDALDFVIMARLEAAYKKLIPTEKKEFLPNILDKNKYSINKDNIRFSKLYVPGNTPKYVIKANSYMPHSIVLDLEDSIAYSKKEEAVYLVRNALRIIDFKSIEKMVRINPLPMGLDELDFIIPHYVNTIIIPKCEEAEQICLINKKIHQIKNKYNLTYQVWLMPIIESCKGVIKAYEIATASDNIAAIAFGQEDYITDLEGNKTKSKNESLFARSMIVNVCKAINIQAIDSVYVDYKDLEGLKQYVIYSKSLGFNGMGCIHPDQINIINEYFSPDENEITLAKKIITAYKESLNKGIGVTTVENKMIDLPIVNKAKRTIEIAIKTNKINPNELQEYLC